MKTAEQWLDEHREQFRGLNQIIPLIRAIQEDAINYPMPTRGFVAGPDPCSVGLHSWNHSDNRVCMICGVSEVTPLAAP